MKSKMNLQRCIIKFLNVFALRLVVQTANSACIWMTHQPKFPEAATKFRK